jgi:hypothetical protein
MKTAIFSIIILAFSLSMMTAIGGEVTGAGSEAKIERALLARGITPAIIRNQGLRVLSGEVTGAGRTVELSKIRFIVATDKVFTMEEATHVEFKAPSNAQYLSEVTALEFDKIRLGRNKIQAVVVEREVTE